MGVGVVSFVFTSIAAFAGWFFAPRDSRKLAMFIAAVWVIALAIGFFIPLRPATFTLIAVLLAVTGALAPRSTVVLYIGIIAAIPLGMAYQIPFPGLNYLMEVDYAKVATLVLLGPVFARVLFEKSPKQLVIVDWLLLFFVLFTSVMAFRDLPFTSVLRLAVDQFVLIYVPYIAISRTLRTQDDVKWALRALFISLVILAVVALISTLRSWNYYVHLSGETGYKSFSDFRNGFLRVGATMPPSLLAFLMGAGVALLASWRRSDVLPKLYILPLAGLFVFVCFVTGTRGGWVAAGICVISFLIFNYANRSGRRLFMVAMGVGVLVGINLIFNDSTVLDDKYGTVSYRAELIRTSMEQFRDRPLFGASDFLQSQRFAHLVQGEGIIDLVNGYIQIALYYGAVGLIAFVGAHGAALRGALQALSKLPPNKKASDDERTARSNSAFLLALQIGYLTMIATISLTQQSPHFGYIILALVVGHARVLATAPARAEALSEKASANEPEQPRASDLRPAPQGPIPYGARFVRPD